MHTVPSSLPHPLLPTYKFSLLPVSQPFPHYPPPPLQVLVLRNVYINVAGHIFNETHFFDHNSCAAAQFTSPPSRYIAQRTRVHYFHTLLTLADWQAWNARSYLLDHIPLFVTLQVGG